MFIDGVVVDLENKNISCSINFLLTITKKYHSYNTKYSKEKEKNQILFQGIIINAMFRFLYKLRSFISSKECDER